MKGTPRTAMWFIFAGIGIAILLFISIIAIGTIGVALLPFALLIWLVNRTDNRRDNEYGWEPPETD